MVSLFVFTALAAGLDCPAGTHEVQRLSRVACEDAAHVLHGPSISLYATGAVEARGQYEHGLRSGPWAFFDEQGAKVGETGFKRGNWHGRRVLYRPDGSVKVEERWAEGERVASSEPEPVIRRKR